MREQGIRIWQWAVLTLMLCNIGLILTIWLRPVSQNHPPHETPRDFVIRNVKFSDEQTKQYDILIKDHQQVMQQLGKHAKEYRQQLFANMKSDAGNSTAADSLAQLIANTQKQIEMATYKHFAQVRALCTDAQKPVFDNIIGDVTRQMAGGMHGPPPHPGDGQGPPPGPPPPDGPPPPNP